MRDDTLTVNHIDQADVEDDNDKKIKLMRPHPTTGTGTLVLYSLPKATRYKSTPLDKILQNYNVGKIKIQYCIKMLDTRILFSPTVSLKTLFVYPSS